MPPRTLKPSRLIVTLFVCAMAVAPSPQAAAQGVRSQAPVGMATRTFHPKAPRNWRNAEHKELRTILWYPAVGGASEVKQFIGSPESPLFEAGTAAPNADFAPSLAKLPLILLSHSSGGSAAQLAWLGTALARAGFVAAAVDHPGNNSREPLTVEGSALWWERAVDLSNVVDGLLADSEFGPRIDTTRIAAAGFSIGAQTALILAGAQADIGALDDLCRGHADSTACRPPQIGELKIDDQSRQALRHSSGESLARSGESYRDPRVRAVFAIAPVLAMTLTPDSLHAIRMPVEVIAGEADRLAPPRENADLLRSNIRGARETILPEVGHYTFLDTCTAAGKNSLPSLCGDGPKLDRDAIHAQVAAMAVTFFTRALKVGR